MTDWEHLKQVVCGWLLLILPIGAIFGVTWWLAPDLPYWKWSTGNALIAVFAYVGATMFWAWTHNWVKIHTAAGDSKHDQEDGDGN